MKIVVSSDMHPDAVTAGFPRFEDVEATARASVEYAIRVGAKLYLFLGDLCDPDRGQAHRCAALGIELMDRLWRSDIASHWLTGNHDVLEDGTGTSTLEPMHAYATILTGTPDAPVVHKRPWFITDRWDFDLLALPYVARSHAYDPVQVVRDAAKEWDGKRRVIVFGHLMLEGITPGSESIDMARGRDLFYPIDELIAAFGDRLLMLNGHYHRRQVHRGVQVVGSLERLTFGEEGAGAGYLVIDTEAPHA